MQTKTTQEKKKIAETLLHIVDALMHELHPNQQQYPVVDLDSSLDKDLGFDSLSKVELISRLEHHFDVSLSERSLSESETPRDLLRFLQISTDRTASKSPAFTIPSQKHQKDALLPRQAETVVEILEWHVQKHPERIHLHFLRENNEVETLTYQRLWLGAEKVAAGLQQMNIEPGQAVALMLPSGIDYFFSFMGIILAGAVPVPIYPPLRPSQLEEHMQRHCGILSNCSARMLITLDEGKLFAQFLRSQTETLHHVITVGELMIKEKKFQQPPIGPLDTAFLQYTSGSTGDPKGVVLSHANLLSNIRAMGESVRAGSSDIFISWLPLYHDMGLIGAWLGSMYFAMLFVVMSPLSFLSRPQNWLWTIHQYRGTLSASPNFGYELSLKHIHDEDMNNLDLSSWRLAFNGAEPVSPDTIDRFSKRFRKVGFMPQTMMPVYGLAESSVGLAFPQMGQEPVIDYVQRDAFMRSGRAVPETKRNRNALKFVACGHPIPGHEIRIADENGRELPERQEGRLQFRGPSATSGYYHNPGKTRQLFENDWLNSGDLAYISGGEVYITGRTKDIIIRGGRNIYPYELEEAIGEVPDIRKGCVAVFGSADTNKNAERLVVLAETRKENDESLSYIHSEINRIVTELSNLPPDDIVLLPSHTILKTSSGKIRRAANRELYEQGKLGNTNRAVWFQLIRLAATTLKPLMRRFRHRLFSILYASYAWSVFAFLAPMAWVATAIIPSFPLRWRVLHTLARSLAWGTATNLVIQGHENLLPAKQAKIFVANHSSYLDGYSLVAALPQSFSFIAKAELASNFISRFFIRRLRAELVERFDAQKGVKDAKRIASNAQQKQTFMFFPEGTFTRSPGLQNFRIGAFITAIEAELPVIPIAIRGTRSILRSGSWFPQRGNITISIGKPIDSLSIKKLHAGNTWNAAMQLRDEARKHIARYCGEPDMAQ